MVENPRRGRQVRNLTTNVPNILDRKSSSEQIFPKIVVGCPCHIRVLYGKVAFACKCTSSLKIFNVKRNKIQLGVDKVYPENN